MTGVHDDAERQTGELYHRLAPGADDDDRGMIVVHTAHHGREALAQIGGGGAFDGGYLFHPG